MLPPNSELIIRENGAIYHLGVTQEQLAKNIITVGDPDRVNMVSKYFDEISFKSQTREFVIHTGKLGPIPLSVLSTGIGTDNIDIVFNEADALYNVMGRPLQPTQLTFIRIGTSGTVHPDIPVDAFVVSHIGLGIDNLGSFYATPDDSELTLMAQAWREQMPDVPIVAYFDKADPDLLAIFSSAQTKKGMTVSCPGFYGPQGRQLRLSPQSWFTNIFNFYYRDFQITNLEMETSAMYRLAHLLGHRTISLNVILANRVNKTFTSRYPQNVDDLIQYTLQAMRQNASFFLDDNRYSRG